MRLVSLSGTLDSGKTTAIKGLITILAARGKSCAVIVNEDGQETYDADFVQRRQLLVEYLRGG
jgi:G3E family GTPase